MDEPGAFESLKSLACLRLICLLGPVSDPALTNINFLLLLQAKIIFCVGYTQKLILIYFVDSGFDDNQAYLMPETHIHTNHGCLH